MRDIDILQYIIDNGECPSGFCTSCPMSQMKRRDKEGYISCWAAVLDGRHDSAIDPGTVYRQKAIELLIELTIEKSIEEDCE